MRSESSPAYLAFDLGASSGRAVLGMVREGRLRMETVHRFRTPILDTEKGLFWDLEKLWRELQTGLHSALNASDNLSSLSVDSWGVDYVPLDPRGEPLRSAYCYRDTRTAGMMEKAFERVSPSEIYRSTGIQFMPINTLYQVLADRQSAPELIGRTANRLPIGDYFNHRFGGRPVAEVSLASTTQLLQVGTRRWAFDLMQKLGLPADGWPKIVASGTAIGAAAAHQATTVVSTCSHDTGCAVAATPARENGWAYISCGTWSLLGIERDAPLVSDTARTAGFTNEAGLDGTIRFLKNLTGLWALQECVREWELSGPGIYDELTEAAESEPPPARVIDLEEDRFLARGGMVERIEAFCNEHGMKIPETRGAMTRLIIESIADSYRRAVISLEEVIGTSIEVIHMVGGGSQNSLLCRLTADRCGKRVVAGPIEATAIGNLLIQARTMGDLREGQSIRDVVLSSFPLKSYVP